ncbi:MAG: sugar-transfer associated ATP-grasp domain-containing protein [Patescibacteria group bacterium]
MSEILGINERNLLYLHPSNPKAAIRLVDDKLATKKLLQKTGIFTPRLYGMISDIVDFENFKWDKLPQSFVVKPNIGFGGGGIVILKSEIKKEEFLKLPLVKRRWVDPEKEVWDFKKLKTHIINILDGNFSLSDEPDTAFIERKIVLHPILRNYVYEGIPDIRIIVYNKVPVMAMLRLPTKKSKGKANLHQGAIGVGIDIGSGITTTAMQAVPRRQIIEKHPDTKQKLRGLILPFWDKILEIAIECQIACSLGYVGVDIVLDSKYGPEVLELNARPGLDIQIANLEGLSSRLRRVRGLKIKDIQHGMRVARELFGEEIEHTIEKISGREIIGPQETIEILNKDGLKKIKVEAKIDTGAAFTSCDQDLAIKLGYKDLVEVLSKYNFLGQIMLHDEAKEKVKEYEKEIKAKYKDIVDTAIIHSATGITYRAMILVTFFLAGKKIISKASIISRKDLRFPIIIGRKNLAGFLVDPMKRMRILNNKKGKIKEQRPKIQTKNL